MTSYNHLILNMIVHNLCGNFSHLYNCTQDIITKTIHKIYLSRQVIILSEQVPKKLRKVNVFELFKEGVDTMIAKKTMYDCYGSNG